MPTEPSGCGSCLDVADQVDAGPGPDVEADVRPAGEERAQVGDLLLPGDLVRADLEDRLGQGKVSATARTMPRRNEFMPILSVRRQWTHPREVPGFGSGQTLATPRAACQPQPDACGEVTGSDLSAQATPGSP